MSNALKVIDQVRHRVADKLRLLLGNGDELTPPAWMFSDPDRLDGSRNIREFVRVGDSMVAWMISQGLAPSHRVLEVGCGVGRMARPLTRHLADGGSYQGIDISLDKVHYCQQTFERRHPNFHFHHANVYSSFYNPVGKHNGCDYRFPFDDETFDLVAIRAARSRILTQLRIV